MDEVMKEKGDKAFEALRLYGGDHINDEGQKSINKTIEVDLRENVNTLSHKLIADDLANFTRACCENLYLIRVYSASEFAILVKRLPNFIAKNKNTKVIMVDGLHHFEHSGHFYTENNDVKAFTKVNAETFFDNDIKAFDEKPK